MNQALDEGLDLNLPERTCDRNEVTSTLGANATASKDTGATAECESGEKSQETTKNGDQSSDAGASGDVSVK